MQPKYTKEQEDWLFANYSACETQEERTKVIEDFMTMHPDKSKRSITAKLSRMDIYVSALKVSKITGTKPETKEQLVKRIEEMYSKKGLDGLDKAPKLTLLKLLGEK